MGDGVPCYGALEIVGLLLLLFIIISFSSVCAMETDFLPVFHGTLNTFSCLTGTTNVPHSFISVNISVTPTTKYVRMMIVVLRGR